MSANLFYVDLYNGKACKSASGDELQFSDWVAGGTVSFGLRFLEYFGGFTEQDHDIAALRVSVGVIDARPVSGRYRIKIGAGAGDSTNTTALLDWNASARAIESALNALPARQEDFSCDELNGSVLIRQVSGAPVALSVVSNRLAPRSFGRISGSMIEGEWVYELRLSQAPLAFSDSATRKLPEAPSISTIQDGGTDPSGVTFWNEIQALRMPANFRGTYQIRYGDYRKTTLLDPTDGPTQLQDAINAMLASLDGSPAGKVNVTNPETNVAHIEFTGELAGTDVSQLAVHVYSAPPGDWTFDLPLDRSELMEALRDQDILSVPFEAEADFYIDPSDHLAGTITRKLWSTTVNIKRPLIWPEMAVVPGIDWLQHNPIDYVPFTESQVVTGPQTYLATIGGSTTIHVTHGLGANNLANVLVRENSAGGRVLRDSEYSLTIPSPNGITLTSPTAPAPDSLIVSVTGAKTVRDFEAHTNTVPQIVAADGYPSLTTFMDDIGSRVEALESILPTTGAGASQSQASGILIELPPLKEILFFKGTADNAVWGEKGLDATKLGRAPYMLPAVHDAVAASFTGGALPGLVANSVWTNDSAGTLDMGRGIYGGKVAVCGHFASDGRVRFAVLRQGSTNSYYPTGFHRELWRIFVNDKMLRLNRTLDVQFGLALQLVQATSNAQWLLVIEKGTAPEQVTPATTGTNLENVVWSQEPILSQRLILTANRQTHSFGARIRRSLVSSVDTLSCDTLLYGVWEGADSVAPGGANFALRARLIQFDTENAIGSDARGWVVYEILNPDGGASPPKAFIS